LDEAVRPEIRKIAIGVAVEIDDVGAPPTTDKYAEMPLQLEKLGTPGDE
jgi:hypothetical protein